MEDVSSFSPALKKVGVVDAIGRVLTRLTATNDCYVTPITRFTAARAPEIAVSDYVRRVAQYADASDTAFVLALIYLDRIQAARPAVILSTLNFHRLFVSATLIAAKFVDDKYYNNAYYARIGGLTREELNRLEIEMLFALGFELTASPEEFFKYTSQLASHAEAELHSRSQPQAVQVPKSHLVPADVPFLQDIDQFYCPSASEVGSEDADVLMADVSVPYRNSRYS